MFNRFSFRTTNLSITLSSGTGVGWKLALGCKTIKFEVAKMRSKRATTAVSPSSFAVTSPSSVTSAIRVVLTL